MSARPYEPVKQDDDNETPAVKGPKQNTFARHSRATAFTIVICALFISLYYFYPIKSAHITWSDSEDGVIGGSRLESAAPLCMSTDPPHVSARPNIWKSLGVSEAAQIRQWLARKDLGLNLTTSDVAKTNDNTIFLVEAFRPSKADALDYLDNDGTAPVRFARASIHHGGLAEPVIRDYLIGPLPISSQTALRRLTDIYHEPEIPINARGFAQLGDMQNMVLRFMEPLAEATQALLGGVARGLPNDTLVAGGSAPFSFDGTFRRMWLNWRRNTAGPWLHPLGFFQYVSMDGTDPAQWKILKIVYDHKVYESVDSFMEAFHNGTLQPLPYPDNKNASWSNRERKGPQRDLDDRAGPRSVSFNGLRFRVNRDEQYVTWMGWAMYLGFDRDMGLSLWDIRFRGERIIYELAPQEAMAQYAGNDPVQATTAWLDRYFGMGEHARDMLPGYDCPYEAIYLPATVHTAMGSQTQERAICIFEMDTGRPLTRHQGYGKAEFGSVKGYVLTVRSISTVGNYDYLFDYIFNLDGTMEVRVSASGYLQAGYWEPKQTGYGARIREQTMGSLHDHVINFKVDLDIAGTANSLLQTTTSVEEVTQPWFDEDWSQSVIQQHIVQRYLATEDESLLKYPTNFQGGYAIMNRNETNAWGNARGYAIHAGLSPIHNTVVGSKRLLKNANWARYNLAVSRRKDEEPTSSSMWNLNLPGKPTVDFHRFFDSESLDQEDLVAWINVGMHHLPQAEDVPNTRTTTSSSSFFLTPLNFFDSDISIDSSNAILVNPPKGLSGAYTFEDYGVRPEVCMPPPVEPFSYTGGVRYGLDGKKAAPQTAEELRKNDELYHRIKLEI